MSSAALTRCAWCAKELKLYGRVACCSMACRDALQRSKNWGTRSCEVCAKPFECRKNYPKRVCGPKCIGELNRRHKQGKRRSAYETVVCKNPGCGRSFERIVTDLKHEFCGKRCRSKFTWATRDLSSKMIHKRYLVKLQSGQEIIVRSRWEAVFIRDHLEKNNLKWEYESKTFDLPDGTTYTPDFVLEDGSLVEIKGYEYGPSLEKVKALRKLGYPVLYADAAVLTRVFGLDLSNEYLAEVAGNPV